MGTLSLQCQSISSFVAMATFATLRKKNTIYHDRSAKGSVASKSVEKSKPLKKPLYKNTVVILLGVVIMASVVLQLLDLLI
ncbi:hypothetical protein BDB01DRAFT_901893 [Pilobolus umbonatus]|nr:hypothetical protein BDB01DRAFT_901893 [Pilobolus umbonatus]